MLKQAFIVTLLLLLELILICSKVSYHVVPAVEIKDLRSPNITNKQVQDYGGTYSIDNTKVIIGREEVSPIYKPSPTSPLSKVGDKLYYHTYQGYVCMNIKTKEEQLVNLPTEGMYYFTPHGYFLFCDSKLFNEYGECLLQSVTECNVYYNALALYTEDALYIIDLNSEHIKKVEGKSIKIKKNELTNGYDIYKDDTICMSILL